jgi:hypothetical protein
MTSITSYPQLLPVEIRALLVDYLPLYMIEVCWQLPFLTQYTAVRDRFRYFCNFTEQLPDAIRRNEVAFIKQYFDSSRAIKLSDPIYCYDSHNNKYVIDSKLWSDAVQYARIDILNIFADIDLKYYVNAKSILLFSHIVNVIPNAVIFRWILTYCKNAEITYLSTRALVMKAIELEDMSLLDALYDFDPHVDWYNEECKYCNCIEIALILDKQQYSSTLMIMIKHQPKLLEWIGVHTWRRGYYWSI